MANAYVAGGGIYARELRRFLAEGDRFNLVIPAQAGIQNGNGS
ncbi:hypothetical protein [Sphingomonas sp. NFX23]